MPCIPLCMYTCTEAVCTAVCTAVFTAIVPYGRVHGHVHGPCLRVLETHYPCYDCERSSCLRALKRCIVHPYAHPVYTVPLRLVYRGCKHGRLHGPCTHYQFTAPERGPCSWASNDALYTLDRYSYLYSAYKSKVSLGA